MCSARLDSLRDYWPGNKVLTPLSVVACTESPDFVTFAAAKQHEPSESERTGVGWRKQQDHPQS